MSDFVKKLFVQNLESGKFKEVQEQLVTELDALEERFETFSNAVQKFVKHGVVEKVLQSVDTQDDNEAPKTDQQTNKKKEPLASEENILVVKVKKEKLSMDLSACSSSTISEIKENIDIKKEHMPAPSWIPPKKKGKQEKAPVRSTRTRGKKASEAQRDSDIIIQNEHIDTINLADADEEEGGNNKQSSTRSTRTKTRKLQEQAAAQSGTDSDSDSRRTTKSVKKTAETAEPEEKRSTRTRTIKKAAPEAAPEEPVEPQAEVRSTRTRTLKKAQKEEEDPPQETRSTRTRTVKKAAAESQAADADVNNLAGAESNKEKDEADAKVPKKSKRVRSDSTDDENKDKKDSKKSKSASPKVNDVTAKTVYEDALDTQPAPLNSTYVAEPQTAPLNVTVTIAPKENPLATSTKLNFNIFDNNVNNALLTDDDSLETSEVKVSPQKAPAKKPKEVFSPYEKTTLKKKVEAFEKLQNATNTTSSGISLWKGTRGTPNIVKEKSKLYTPLVSKFNPASSSTTKINRLLSSHQLGTTNNESLLAMKTAQKESRDKQRKQMEREQALKKKEAMLQVQAEAKRKQNEEKQLKAQQQRKLLEAEKQKQLELQKQKEERYRQRELEKEEYLKAQKLELEKKRLEQKKRIREMQARQREDQKEMPIYMTTRMPKLPTNDCYDSDDPDYKNVDPPSWSTGEKLRNRLLSMLAAGDRIKNTLFCRHAQTPDLVEIFEVIDPHKLKRSSSIMWKAPPRYTMMPNLNDTRFSEDDELYDSD